MTLDERYEPSRLWRVYCRALARYERRERIWGLTTLAVYHSDSSTLAYESYVAAIVTRSWIRPLVKQARDLVARLEP